jgi:hypothetical protein
MYTHHYCSFLDERAENDVRDGAVVPSDLVLCSFCPFAAMVLALLLLLALYLTPRTLEVVC